jgi:hypothetical protein
MMSQQSMQSNNSGMSSAPMLSSSISSGGLGGVPNIQPGMFATTQSQQPQMQIQPQQQHHMQPRMPNVGQMVRESVWKIIYNCNHFQQQQQQRMQIPNSGGGGPPPPYRAVVQGAMRSDQPQLYTSGSEGNLNDVQYRQQQGGQMMNPRGCYYY